MTRRNDLDLEQKMNLIKDKERGLSHRASGDKFQVSVGAVSNILKRKHEYVNDYELNRNKKVKRKVNNDFSQTINDSVYEWSIAQRAKRIPVSGPVLKEYARKIAEELGDSAGFKASNGWLDRFRTRYSIQFRAICGEAAAVDKDTVEEWKSRLPKILEHYNPGDIYNCDETGLFFKLMPDRSLVVDEHDCKGGKRSKERYTVLLCANWAGTDKLKHVVIGKAAKPGCFKNLDMAKLPVTWCHNRTAWMNGSLFTNWLHEFDTMIRKQRRQILLFLDNAPVHPSDIQLKHITLQLFPANTISKIQPMDQGVIRTFKAYYRRQLVQHIITNANTAYTADYVTITALDAVCWIDSAWKSVTEEALRNTFKEAGFESPVISPDIILTKTTFTDEDVVAQDNTPLNELNKVLKHLTIGGDIMSATDFVSVDDDVPVFNEWDDASEKLLIVDGILNEDASHDDDDDPIIEQLPSFYEAVTMVRRLHSLSTIQHPELHLFVTQLQSKLIDVFLNSSVSKQRSIYDFLKPV